MFKYRNNEIIYPDDTLIDEIVWMNNLKIIRKISSGIKIMKLENLINQ